MGGTCCDVSALLVMHVGAFACIAVVAHVSTDVGEPSLVFIHLARVVGVYSP